MRQLTRLTTITAVLALAWAASLRADQWNEKTVLTFSEAVMVPGATLKPGTYVFQIPDAASSRHIVRIYTENEERVVTTVPAIPMTRPEATNDIALRFNPTDQTAPPALKGWFYPGSRYGHQFIYSDEEAKRIAERTKTLVLGEERPGSDKAMGKLHTYDAAGIRAEWKHDAAIDREWRAWQQSRTSGDSGNASNREQTKAASTTAIVDADFKGTRVKLEDLEDHPAAHLGKAISVDGEVDDVLGPRLFTIDEPNWIDLEGELLVYMPAPLAALVRDNDRVTVTGTVKRFVEIDVDREWGWLGLGPELELAFSGKAVIVADRIIGGDSDRALMISAKTPGDRAVGTRGTTTTSASAPVTTPASLASADDRMVGREVALKGVKVTGVSEHGGFYVASEDRQLFVLSGAQNPPKVSTGQTVSIEGVVMQMPDRMRDRLKAPEAMNRQVYVYATAVH